MDHREKRKRKTHPKDKNSVISNILFLYTVDLFRKGFKKDLKETDLYEVLYDYRSKILGDQLQKQWESQTKQKNNSIMHLLWKCYGYSFLLIGMAQLIIEIAEVTLQPYILGKLISYFSPGQTNLSEKDAYSYATLLICFHIFGNIYRHNYLMALTGLGIKIRTAMCSLVYRKILNLNPAYLEDISIGKLITLITKDVQTFNYFIDFGNNIWVGVIKSMIAFCILYRRIGMAALAGIAFYLIAIPLQIYLGTKVTLMKIKACQKTDKRLQSTQETLSAIKVIKMYTWEKLFATKISVARKNEVYATYNMFFLRSMIVVIGGLTSYLSIYVLLTTYVRFGNNITAENVYFVLSIFEGLSGCLGTSFPIAICLSADLQASVTRLQSILQTVDFKLETKKPTKNTPTIGTANLTVEIKSKTLLQDVSFSIRERGLNIITGPVGCGKSSLLKALLQIYKPREGSVMIEGNVSYASQEPWLFPSSMKQNIVFGQKYDQKRYQEVLKVCALIYDIELLEDRDSTIVEDGGNNLSKGQQARISLARAVYKDSDIYMLDDSLAAIDAHVSDYIVKECFTKFLKNKIVIWITKNLNYFKYANKIIVMDNGRIKKNNTQSKNIVLHENITDNDRPCINGKFKPTSNKKVYHENKKVGQVDWVTYKRYIQLGGGFIAFFIVFSVFGSAQWATSYTDKLISEWVNLEEKTYNYTINFINLTGEGEPFQERNKIVYLYGVMTLVTTFATVGRVCVLLFFTRRAAVMIHKKVITSIINATMRFFDTTFLGNILNRLSKDLTDVDGEIPSSIYQAFRAVLAMIGAIMLIITVNLMFLLAVTIFFLILVAIRQYCVRTTRNLKRLDNLTRSPIIGHLNATLEGLTTIKTFGTEEILKHEFDLHQDLYTSADYILKSSLRAFSLILDTLSGFFIAVVIIKFLLKNNDTLTGDVGLAITQAFMLSGTLQWAIRVWTDFENYMTSVERVLEYTEIKQENKQGIKLNDWPEKGEIKYENVNLRYTASQTPVLKNINFAVASQEKIGIVGRTGVGKSSIISTLFRLYEVTGTITIDGTDTKMLSLSTLRSNISIIPQDPILFSGTIRYNIDPASKYTDTAVWQAIETANIRNLVPSLQFEIIEGGSNFSIGQKQLICLARALLRKNKIVVLDEATSIMDVETETLIHRTIKENFKLYTVLIIAHKLHLILDCDKVMVIKKGKIVEYDNPAILLENENGIFSKLVTKAGENLK